MNTDLLVSSVEILQTAIDEVEFTLRANPYLEPFKFHFVHASLAKIARKLNEIIEVVNGSEEEADAIGDSGDDLETTF